MRAKPVPASLGTRGDGAYADRAPLEFDPLKAVSIYRLDQDPQGSQDRIPTVDLPAIVEGAIDRPGKTDHFRFKAEAGEALAFELEPPREGVSHLQSVGTDPGRETGGCVQLHLQSR